MPGPTDTPDLYSNMLANVSQCMDYAFSYLSLFLIDFPIKSLLVTSLISSALVGTEHFTCIFTISLLDTYWIQSTYMQWCAVETSIFRPGWKGHCYFIQNYCKKQVETDSSTRNQSMQGSKIVFCQV